LNVLPLGVMCRTYAGTRLYLDPCLMNGLTVSFPTIGRGAGINKAIVDYTSPALCTPAVMGVAGKGVQPLPGRCHLQPARLLRNDPFCFTTLLASNDPFAAIALQCIVSREENPQNCPFPLGFRHPAGGGPIHDHRQHAQEIW